MDPEAPNSDLASAADAPSRTFALNLATWLGLAMAVLAVYAQTVQFDFVNFDDGEYVYRNVHVQAGLTGESLKWAFTSMVVGHWVPVTMLSHAAVNQFFQQSGVHHLVNVLIHLLASILLFTALNRATGARWPSAFTAFVFALHPLHVESVAWVSERKDTMCAFFWFLALLAYVRYVEKPGAGRYLAVTAAFALGLMSKAMLVTFPFALLLFDFWPLRRRISLALVWEKVPFLAMSAAAAAVVYSAQREGYIVDLSPAMRVENAVVSYVTYLFQTIWPARLAVFYPLPGSIAPWRVVLAGVVIAGISAVTIRSIKRRPYLAMGWFWYVGTLVPVIGVVQVGHVAHADHFLYIPMIGLTIMLAWGALEATERWPQARNAAAGAGAMACLVLMVMAWKQTSYWNNSETLYTQAISVTEGNWLAEGNLGQHLMDQPGRMPEAMEHMEMSLRYNPKFAESENNLGLCLARVELCAVAVQHFESALRIQPNMVAAHNNLSLCLIQGGNYTGAIDHLETALRLLPDMTAAHFNLAQALSKVGGRDQDAIEHYEAGLRASRNAPTPDNAQAHRYLAALLVSQGRKQEAIPHFEAAQQIQPDTQTSQTIDRLRNGQ